jgi:hypothetical protein
MLFFTADQNIHLSSTWGQGSHPAFDSKKQQFRYVPEIETNPPAIRSTVFSDFVPHDIGFVCESPSLHDRQAFWQQGVRAPQIQVASWKCELSHRKGCDLIKRHRPVTVKPPMLRADLPRSIREPPWRIN